MRKGGRKLLVDTSQDASGVSLSSLSYFFSFAFLFLGAFRLHEYLAIMCLLSGVHMLRGVCRLMVVVGCRVLGASWSIAERTSRLVSPSGGPFLV